MGNLLSLVRLTFTELLSTARQLRSINARLGNSPGLPAICPTRSFWMYPPSPVANHHADVPAYADVVVIGSGITGTSVTRALLNGWREAGGGANLKLVMLEAREACSGATGRNGGHISPPLYSEWLELRKKHGHVVAQKIIKFRLAHVEVLKRVAEEEGILESSQWRETELVDVYYDDAVFKKAREQLRVYQRDVTFESIHHWVYEVQEAMANFGLASDVVGCIAGGGAGAIHPYHFVTRILSNLLARYPTNFTLCTHTPCTAIWEPSADNPYYSVWTPKGTIRTPHVVHATNAWCSHLLERMRGKIVPLRGNVSAQCPGQSLPHETPNRSYVLFSAPVGYDYLTQLPDGGRELMLGSAFAQHGKIGYEEVGNADDSVYNKRIGTHLSGVLPRYFGENNWGSEGQPSDKDAEAGWWSGRVKAIWSGIIGISADWTPWVGRLPTEVSRRQEPPVSSSPKSFVLPDKEDSALFGAHPGEWIAAGYSGEGMVHAWLCGKALAEMILNREGEAALADWFPDAMRVTPERWKRANLGSLASHL